LKILNTCFLLLFFLMLALPLAFIDFSSERVSVQENRMLTDHPKLADIRNNPETFVKDFDAWFKDSIGFRNELISLYKAVNKKRLGNIVHYTDGQYTYLIGEQGHHYFAYEGGILISKFQGKKFLSDKQLSNIAAKLEEVKAYLDSKGIPFIVMFCTDKESIYPEFYPKSIKQGPEPIQVDVITEYFQTHTSVDIFNIRQALVTEKNKYLLYNVSSDDLAHYNEIGAFFAYRELMNHINKYFPQITPYGLGDIEIIFNENGTPYVILKSGYTYKKFDSSFFDNIDVKRPFTDENHAYENKNSDLPVVLVLGDSYAQEYYIGKYIAQQFGKAIFINFTNLSNIREYINYFKPDIVIFESAERELSRFADSVIGIPELP